MRAPAHGLRSVASVLGWALTLLADGLTLMAAKPVNGSSMDFQSQIFFRAMDLQMRPNLKVLLQQVVLRSHLPDVTDYLGLDMTVPECLPSHDFEWELVRYYNRDQIDAVIIDGQICMENGRPVFWDTEELRQAAMLVAKTITSASGIKRCHGSSEMYRPDIS